MLLVHLIIPLANGGWRKPWFEGKTGLTSMVLLGMFSQTHRRCHIGEASSVVPRVVDAVAPTPVVAAGGIADARALVAALALGAEGVALGTRLLATPEAAAHPLYKQKVLEATEEDIVRTTLCGYGWPNAAPRTLRTAFVNEWLGQEARGSEQRSDEPVIGETVLGAQRVPVLRFMGFPPSTDATGDIESMDLLAGQSVGLVREIKPAALIIRELVEGARQIIEHRLKGTLIDS
jgi:nitronate monooxygenase